MNCNKMISYFFVNCLSICSVPNTLGEISKTRGMHACIIMPPMPTDNETDESIKLLASV